MEKITTGLKELDKLLNGGFPSNTVILISGGPGTGKTLVSLNFLLEGAKKEKKCFYLSFNEGKNQLLRASSKIKSLKPIGNFVGRNLAIEKLQLNEKFNTEYLVNMFRDYPQIDRLVIDNVNKMMLFSKNNSQYRKQLSDIVEYLRDKVSCTLLLCETSKDNIDNGGEEAFECDGVIKLSFLEFEERPVRTLKIHKMRYSDFEPKVSHELVINRNKIELTAKKVI